MANPDHITGLDEVIRNFNLSAKDVRNFSRSAVNDVAKDVRGKTRANAPDETGQLQKKIRHKRRRGRRDYFRSAVVILAGPPPKRKTGMGALVRKLGRKSQDDDSKRGPFYWFFLEYGTRKRPAQPFVDPARKAAIPGARRTFINGVVRRAIKAAERRATA